MTIAKQKQIHRNKEQTSGEREEERDKICAEEEAQSTGCKITEKLANREDIYVMSVFRYLTIGSTGL